MAQQPQETMAMNPDFQAIEIGKYRLIAKVGRGGMAGVYLAVARGPVGFNKLVVIKRLLPQFVEEDAVREMFLDEARLAARLNHPNVVQTFEVNEHRDTYYIAMEYLEGQSLRSFAREMKRRKERIPPNFAARIIADVLKGLEHAHELRDYDGTPIELVHRDVSPHNIFITYDGQVKLVDFGVAKAANQSQQTEVGVIKGKVSYMAPEQALGESIDHRADIFAVGVVFWEMLTNQRLLRAGSATASLIKLINMTRVEPPSEHVKDLDPMLDQIVLKALERDPDDRYASARELREALESYLERTGNVRQEAIGERMIELFKDVRDKVHERIRAEMARIPLASTGSFSVASFDSLDSVRLSHSDSSSLRGTCSDSSNMDMSISGSQCAPVNSEVLEPRAPSRKSAPRLALSLAFAAIAVLAIVLLLAPWNRGATEPGGTSPLPTVALPANTVDPEPISTTPESAPAPSAPVAAVASDEVAEIVPPRPGTTFAARPPAATRPSSRSWTNTTTTVAAPAPSEVPSLEKGFLTIDSAPWSNVSVSGRAVGTTPVSRVPLDPGPYTVVLVNPELGLRKGVSVTIRPAKTTSLRVPLQ